ncbi:flagellar type III secretion system pore protein FliP [Caloramator sp. E03]|uniref:flagellar type III secretion system pore protein FliP n=1 Tax=Caloramator sp. E03 TaxID=2576307 RepID=UPI00111032A5|nr:flagellar type III secretion system pore protein FliP [Caloramator sp. E03]QCX32340.1 flagellar type III secretion system pore protein FliP [Caloramator sp. E03]
MNRRLNKIIYFVLMFTLLICVTAYAEPNNIQIPKVTLSVDSSKTPKEYVDNIKLLLLLTSLTFIPAMVLMMTSFTRIIIVFGFVRNALSTQQSPPNQILIGLALFMTIFIMSPVYTKVNNEAIQPYLKGEITQDKAIEIGSKPIKDFMLKQTREKDIALFYTAANIEKPKDRYEVPFKILIPSFVISELKTAFQMGFLIYVPFIVIDMVVASILMSMGMFMLPPVTISLPFKILLFVLADGWHLIVKALIQSFI